MPMRNRFSAFVDKFVDTATSAVERRRIALLIALSLVGIVFLILFAILAFAQDTPALGYFDLATALVLALNLVDANRRRQTRQNIRIGLVFISILYVYLYVSGGVNATAFSWYFTYPLITNFLLGSRIGATASMLMLVPVVALQVIAPANPFFAQYSLTFVFRFAAAYIVVTVFAYFFERTREDNDRELVSINASLEAIVNRRTELLTIANQQLETDIRNRERIEQTLKEREAKYRSIVENISDVICVHDLEGHILETNLHYQKDFGYDRDELIGQNIGDLIEDRYQDAFRSRLRELSRKGADEGVFSIRTKSGQQRILEYSNILVKNPDGQYVVQGFAKDITERWKVEKALETSEKRYRTLFEKAGDAIFILDASPENQGAIVDANRAAAEMHGYSIEELKQRTIKELDAPEDAEKIAPRIQEMLAGKWIKAEIDHVHKDGTRFPVEVSAGVFELDDRPYILAFDRDITRRREMEERLRRTEKMEALGTLAGGIAHDFNNLLLGIQGHVSLIDLDLPEMHPFKEHSEAIDDYVQSAANLTKQLLGLARGGKYEVRPIDLSELMTATADMFGRTRKEIPIHISAHATPLVVEADKGQLEQVLLNFLLNACQAMPDGGDLYLGSAAVLLGEEDSAVYQLDPGRYARISVRDSGIGMDAATAKRIFDPFFTTKEKERGTGLGLASAYGIVKNHDGAIVVDSAVGEGTTFEILLPLSDKAPSSEERSSKILATGSETILLVDDEEMIIKVGQAMLERAGYRVQTARDGAQAVEFVRRQGECIDLIILDLIMPHMNGRDAFDAIRALPSDIPILLSSGYALDGQAAGMMQKGCNGFIQKPFSVTALTQKVRALLEDSRTARPPASTARREGGQEAAQPQKAADGRPADTL